MIPTTKNPNTGLGILPSSPRNPPYGPRSRPKIFGAGTGELELPPPHVVLRKTNCSIATAAASVTTARLTPRTRSAETAIDEAAHGCPDRADQHSEREPDAVVDGEVRQDEAGDSRERELDDRDLADEARDHDERQAHDRREERRDQRLPEVVGEDDQCDDRRRPSRSTAARPEPLGARSERQPLLDQLAAAREARPAHEHRDHHEHEDEERLHAGHRDAVVGREPAERLEVVEDVLEHPDREPDERRDPERGEVRRRAPRSGPGRPRSGSAVESSWVIDAASTPRAPATIVASDVLASASWFGASPISMAPTSFSEAARVARPNRLNLKRSESASVAQRTIAGRIRRSTGTIAPSSLTVFVGSTVGCGLVPIPNASDTAGLRDEQHAERRRELGERRRGPQRPERCELDQHARSRAGRGR